MRPGRYGQAAGIPGQLAGQLASGRFRPPRDVDAGGELKGLVREQLHPQQAEERASNARTAARPISAWSERLERALLAEYAHRDRRQARARRGQLDAPRRPSRMIG